MPAEPLIFRDAEKARNTITLQQRRDIKRLYAEWAAGIGILAAFYPISNSNENVSEWQFRDFIKNVFSAGEHVPVAVEGIVTKNMLTMSEAVFSANTKWLTSLGLDNTALSASTSSIPNDVVQRLITGQYYEQDWSLSKSIWGDNAETHKQILEIVEGGRVQGKSIYEISKDIERYVNPDKVRPWNLRDQTGRKIYPRDVEYNSQRLARTLVQHSYQQSFIEATKDNDLIEDYIWIANGPRVCPICIDRDGKHFPKDELPLDHPNGMCVFVPNLVKNWKQQLADMLP